MCKQNHKDRDISYAGYFLYYIVYPRELGREPLEVCCDRTVRSGGTSRHTRITKPFTGDLFPW